MGRRPRRRRPTDPHHLGRGERALAAQYDVRGGRAGGQGGRGKSPDGAPLGGAGAGSPAEARFGNALDRSWGLLPADSEREYRIDPDQVDTTPVGALLRRLAGLPPAAPGPAGYRETPLDADSRGAIAAVTGRYLGR